MSIVVKHIGNVAMTDAQRHYKPDELMDGQGTPSPTLIKPSKRLLDKRNRSAERQQRKSLATRSIPFGGVIPPIKMIRKPAIHGDTDFRGAGYSPTSAVTQPIQPTATITASN